MIRFPAVVGRSPAQLSCVVFLAVLAACGGTNSSGTGNGTGFDVAFDKDGGLGDAKFDGAQVDGVPGDSVGGDDLADGTQQGDGSDDVPPAGDATQTDTTKTCEFAAQPGPGEPGATCKANTDCQSNLCVTSPTGKVCTVTCTDCCPTGYTCSAYGTGTDQTFACLPKVNALCQPCKSDGDCGPVKSGAFCVSYGEAGSFCGAPCGTDSDCPGDYACQPTSSGGNKANQCIKKDQACTCSPAAIAEGAETACSSSTEFGVCPGVRKCGANGLTDCNAPTPLPETCGNGKDDNCDGATDDEGALGCTTYYTDADGDGAAAKGSTGKCICAPEGLYTATTATDCNDNDKSINTAAIEQCDGIDNDCDGVTDDGCDDDGDGWCDANLVVIGTPAICGNGKKDCDDTSATVHPDAVEVCGNFIDDNCDGQTDSGDFTSGCVSFYKDSDGDGFGTGVPNCQCAAAGLYSSVTPGDCDDTAQGVNPGAAEVCSNGVDDNCNGTQDEPDAQGCLNYYVDLDADGYGVATPTCLCAATGDMTAKNGGDCDDSQQTVHPNATETCDGIDNNCVGGIDEEDASGCLKYYVDQDGDLYGDAKKSSCLCAASLAFPVTDSTDCNDAAKTANPGVTETCDGIDNDCDGQTDEADAGGCQVYFVDADNDGYGDTLQFACLCKATATYKVTALGDCDDANKLINPGAKEVCDGIDNNCTGTTDENGALGCSTYYYDGDKDGFGPDNASECLCQKAGLYTATQGGDCDDADSAVNPNALETCDGIDNDCNGVTDPANSNGCEAYYVDKDGDGYGTSLLASKCVCAALPGYAKQANDCNDNDNAVNPAATEVCNGKDDNCDGVKDPKNTQGCTTFYADGDGDGYGVNNLSQCACVADTLFKATLPGDCNDGNSGINPGHAEVCNGLDDNCNNLIDEGVLATYYQDLDGDGWGGGVSNVQCGADAAYSSSTSGDCDDSKFAINPGATEICNYVDDNCNGQTDENTTLTLYYQDLDGDTFGAGAGQSLCGPQGKYTVTDGTDCDDNKFSVHPGVPDVCDGLDNNCNGETDENLPTSYYFVDTDKDSWGTGSGTLLCGPIGTKTAAVGGDCNDGNPLVYPGANEVCDGADNNCDGTTDEGFATSTYYVDGDGDTYGGAGSSVQCGAFGGFTVTTPGDCNDSSATVHPNATEVCANAIDDNCDGQTDENCTPKCNEVQYNFEAGTAPGWTLGAGWTVGSWAGASGVGKGLGYGTGTAYPTSASGSTASVQLYIPVGATTIQFDYRYSPDVNESVTLTGYDQIAISLGSYINTWTRDSSIGAVAWTHFTFTGIPAAWGGTYQTFALKFTTKDSLYNNGFGYAIDNISVNCP